MLTVSSGAPAWAAPTGGSGGSALPLDALAAADVGSGDLFGGTTLDGGWSSLDATPLNHIDASVDGYLILGNDGSALGSNAFRGIQRAFVPSGDFMVWARCDFFRANAAFQGWAVWAGASNPSSRVDALVYNSSGTLVAQINKWTTGSRANQFDGSIGNSPLWMQASAARPVPMWLAIRRVGTAIAFGISQDGVLLEWHTSTTTIGFTVETCGIAIMQQSTNNPARFTFDYIATTG